jgi:predicted PurR-regulated permease PerM
LARSLLLPIFLALFLSAFLQPLVKKLNRFRIPDSAGAAVVLLLFVVVFGGAVYQLSAPAADWMKRGPDLLRRVDYKLWKVKQAIKEAEKKTQQLEDMTKLNGSEEKVAVKGPSLAERAFTRTWSFLATVTVVLALVYFLLAQGRWTLHRLAESLQDGDHRERLDRLLLRIQQDIVSYLSTIAVVYLITGTLTAVAMSLLGMPTPALWGGVAFALHFIPFLGPITTFLILCTVSAMVFETWLRIILPPSVYLVLAVLEGHFVTPIILGRHLTLNPIMVFVAFLFWGWMWGIPGVFLAVPILTGLKIICDDIEWLKPTGQVLGSEKTKERLATKRKRLR